MFPHPVLPRSTSLVDPRILLPNISILILLFDEQQQGPSEGQNDKAYTDCLFAPSIHPQVSFVSLVAILIESSSIPYPQVAKKMAPPGAWAKRDLLKHQEEQQSRPQEQVGTKVVVATEQ